MRSYEEYQWEWLKSFELYELWKREDFHLLLERESKSVRYVLHFVWDCLNMAEAAKSDGDEDNMKEFLELARKYFTWIAHEIKNPNVVKLLVERFEELDGKKEGRE